jgi:hypothetical protein
VKVVIPMVLPSVANLREHWAAKARRTKAQRAAVSLLVPRASPEGRVVVTLTRVAPRPIKDAHDNLRSAFKHIVDSVAERLGIDDGSPRIAWLYRQRKGPAQVEIEIQEAP